MIPFSIRWLPKSFVRGSQSHRGPRAITHCWSTELVCASSSPNHLSWVPSASSKTENVRDTPKSIKPSAFLYMCELNKHAVLLSHVWGRHRIQHHIFKRNQLFSTHGDCHVHVVCIESTCWRQFELHMDKGLDRPEAANDLPHSEGRSQRRSWAAGAD